MEELELSTKAILDYARLKSRIDRLEKRKERISDQIKERMREEDLEEFGPRDSPFKFRVSRYNKASVKWKEVATKFARKLFGKDLKKELEKETEQYPDTPVESLYCEFNEKYRHPEDRKGKVA